MRPNVHTPGAASIAGRVTGRFCRAEVRHRDGDPFRPARVPLRMLQLSQVPHVGPHLIARADSSRCARAWRGCGRSSACSGRFEHIPTRERVFPLYLGTITATRSFPGRAICSGAAECVTTVSRRHPFPGGSREERVAKFSAIIPRSRRGSVEKMRAPQRDIFPSASADLSVCSASPR